MKKAVGYISYSHGLDGKVKIVPMVDNEQFKDIILKKETIFLINENNIIENLKLDIFAFNGKIFICRIVGVNSIEQAKYFLKKEIYIEVENDEDFIDAESLIGYDVISYYNNNIIGKVIDCGDYGSGMLIEVKLLNTNISINNKNKPKKQQSEFYLCNKEVITKIDIQNKQIIVKNYNN